MSKFVLAPCGNWMRLPVRFSRVTWRMLIRSWVCLPFVLLLFSLHGYAQTMVPEFTANQTAGCVPFSVSFRDLTSGNPRFWNWDFGNGTLSNVQHPSVIYGQPGTYTVTLVVRNPDGTTGITKTNFITVYPSPSVGFTANITTGCVPVNIQFTDQSTTTSGNIVSWLWDFGDGTTSTAQNPSHAYNKTGFYNVSLTATSSTGCKSTYTASRYIRIVSGVKAEFNNSKPVGCQAPYNINFTNLSSGPGNMTFQWDLGNGANSTASNPSTTYGTTGTYNVTLTATSEFGCSGTITKQVILDGPSTSIGVPDTVCQNQKTFFENNTSVAPQKTLWDFGNGDQSTNTDDNTIYPISGDYTVKLFNTFAACKDSAIKVIHVRPSPSIDFTVSNAVACKAPLNVTFQDISPAPITNWQWNFGDGGTGTGANPTHTYNAAGNFDVSVIFTDNKGCEGKITKPAVVQIEVPTVKINTVPAGGCVPYTYTPTATVTAIDGVASWLWDFGDGTTSTQQNPTHTYNSTGSYDIRLTITTNSGCTIATTEVEGVKVGTPPATNFSMSATDVCASEAISFTDLTPPPADWWEWDFGDGGSSTVRNPSHIYLDSGTFIVKLTAYNNRCPSKSTGQAVHIKPPIAKFGHTITCGSLTVAFTDLSKTDPSYGPISYSWAFGNPALPGGPYTQQNPSFTFPAYGIYPVTLSVTNGSCTHTFTDTVKLVKEQAKFAPLGLRCRDKRFEITSTNTPQYITKYEWSIDGSPFVTDDASYTANIITNGVHSVGLVITDINGCTDTLIDANAVTIIGPYANFTAATPGSCRNAPITFNDHSTTSGSLVKWAFHFGDGTIQSFTKAPFTHVYTDTGAYVPLLTVEDDMGCEDSYLLPDTLFITTPKADFTSDYNTICPTSNVQFTDASFGKDLTYFWDFGNGGTSTMKDPIFSYGGNNATYSVKLVIADRGGCKDSLTRTNYITTLKPIPTFDILDTLTICPPIETKFTFRGTDYESFEWDFGDGSTSTLLNPTHFYNTYGDFTPKLILTGYGGCKDSVSKNVHVYNPNSITSLNYSPLDACNEITVDFTLATIPDMQFAFHFGDGTVDTTMATTYQHYYSSPAFYSPSIQYTDKQGCIAGVGGPPIKVIGAEPFFGVDRKKFCDSGVVYFTNYTIGNDPVASRTWNFGDGSPTSSDVDPTHQYQRPGTFAVSQSVTTQQGCSKTITDTIRVYRTPDPYIVGDSIGCLNETLNLQGMLTVPDTAITWKWTLANNNFLSTQNISLNFEASGNYAVKLQATNLLGCTDTTSKNLFVPAIPTITVAEDPVIPVTTGITLPVTYGPEVVKYNWTPAKNLSCIDCPTPYANPKFTTTYTVKVADQYGCTNTQDVTVTVVCNGLNYFVPNTFSPNGDGVNDIFAPRGVGLARVNSMRIFNRWGEMVYERMNFLANDRTPTGGWDGTYKGKPASSDVYIYIIEFVCENAAIVPVKGNVALVR